MKKLMLIASLLSVGGAFGMIESSDKALLEGLKKDLDTQRIRTHELVCEYMSNFPETMKATKQAFLRGAFGGAICGAGMSCCMNSEITAKRVVLGSLMGAIVMIYHAVRSRAFDDLMKAYREERRLESKIKVLQAQLKQWTIRYF